MPPFSWSWAAQAHDTLSGDTIRLRAQVQSFGWIYGREKIIPLGKMITAHRGETAVPDIEQWANNIARSTDDKVQISVYDDPDSNTYVLRLAKGQRILVFRLSEAQIHTPEREAECERTLKRKIKDLAQEL
ncbi:MAG: hypothetical protein HY695_14400 [Deltaproteobacteria bacterium]|nr:hypothetical protein [Deltaproteobacteria bacterium]